MTKLLRILTDRLFLGLLAGAALALCLVLGAFMYEHRQDHLLLHQLVQIEVNRQQAQAKQQQATAPKPAPVPPPAFVAPPPDPAKK